jgi:hypothetical protein
MSPLDLSANRALPYALRARVEFRDPENCLRRLCDHMREHGMHVHEDDGVFTVILPDVVGSLSKDGRYVTVEAAAADLEAFYFVKMWLQAEFSELAGHPAPLIEWNEESRNLRFPPSFRTLAVVTVRDITPRMRRITFKGNDLNRFDTLSALHLQLLINLGAVTEQCRRQCDFSDSETLQDAPVWRRYTVRSVDRARGTIDVDFFLHGSSGPGANWARQARPGDLVGVAGPSGGGIAKANWYFLAGDETALPAIASHRAGNCHYRSRQRKGAAGACGPVRHRNRVALSGEQLRRLPAQPAKCSGEHRFSRFGRVTVCLDRMRSHTSEKNSRPSA